MNQISTNLKAENGQGLNSWLWFNSLWDHGTKWGSVRVGRVRSHSSHYSSSASRVNSWKGALMLVLDIAFHTVHWEHDPGHKPETFASWMAVMKKSWKSKT